MPKPEKKDPVLEAAERAAAALAGFDYSVDQEDFVLYELHRLIEEDRASFDDAEFRTLIDAGVRAHAGERPEIRAKLAGRLRSAITPKSRTVLLRVVHALEDLTIDLTNVGVIVRNYTAYMLSRLESVSSDADANADDQISGAADLLFEST